ncbi:kinase-like domain-containing protein [Rhizophagus irregularis DAOM 181602=DAOM 197198]|nr:kinase-like domain-containing protein [Rhizophagus irregularis DAOM 181602=DAOM 197198]
MSYNKTSYNKCKKCHEIYTDTNYKWLYNDNSSTIYLARWKNGPLYWDHYHEKKYIRTPHGKEITIKYTHNLQSIDEFLNEVKEYSINFKVYGISQNPNTNEYILILENEYDQKYVRFSSNKVIALKFLHNLKDIDEFLNEVKEYLINFKIYGMSQNPDTKDYIMALSLKDYCTKCCIKCNNIYPSIYSKWCKSCQIENLKENFINWTSKNEEIDDFIQEKQLNINDSSEIIFEWIPSNQFLNINEVNKDDSSTVCSAKWKDGPLYWGHRLDKKYIRLQKKEVTLKYLHNLQNVDEFLNEVKAYSINFKIDENNFSTIYLAKWKNGPLRWDENSKEYKKHQYEEVSLKCSHNSQSIDEFLTEVQEYLTNFILYGISQNPVTKDYIIAFLDKDYCINCNNTYTEVKNRWCKQCQINNLRETLTNWTSGNEKIDDFIQEKQLGINDPLDVVFEWIPYNQFCDIKEIDSDDFSTVLYSAKWNSGPLYWGSLLKIYTREPDMKVILKHLYNLQNIDGFLNEVKAHSINFTVYGISQNPDTNDYILVWQDKYGEYCKKCNNVYTNVDDQWQLEANGRLDVISEWIPYNQFLNIKEIGKGGFATIYSATWKGGPLNYCVDKSKYTRILDKMVALKCLHNSQNITNEFLNEIKEYSIDNHGNNIVKIYGLSQNPDTKEFIIILDYAEGGNLNNWLNKNYKYFSWLAKINTLLNISNGLKEIHQKQRVHRDLHTGNILLFVNNINIFDDNIISISDMGLCGEVDNIDKSNIYGVMPYVAPEVLRRKPYTQAADIYSFALDICNEIRPEINEQEVPKCYIDLMKRCWDSNPENRPNSLTLYESILQFRKSYRGKIIDTGTYDNETDAGNIKEQLIQPSDKIEKYDSNEIDDQFKKAEEYRIEYLSFEEDNQSDTHPQAIFIARLLNSFTDELPEFDDDKSEALDCKI